ncbi:unnamed protein product [Fusarium equiseti]|uniref:SMODS and SLOG-associating 2TM effector domain-containing protein n=1 Tax=Fusarium equiseti TaxID=61235 RepID=A0A8J2NDN6_FUSEQ|nr:unnamed protein product [Fusarium equiseti]
MSKAPVSSMEAVPMTYIDYPHALDPEASGSNPKHSNSTSMDPPDYRVLSSVEWDFFARGVGGIRDKEHDAPVMLTSSIWPPKGLPPGLYRDTVHRRTVSLYLFHFAAYIRWILLILQLIIGAALTALGPFSLEKGTPITILGASNTVLAGLLALFTHSGLPDRYRYDKAEFERVEDHIREILVAGLVCADKSVNEALAECYDLYQHAKITMEVNVPAAYIPSQGVLPGQRMHQPRTPTQGKEPKGPSTLTKSPKTSLEEEPITSHESQSSKTTPKEATEGKGTASRPGE